MDPLDQDRLPRVVAQHEQPKKEEESGIGEAIADVGEAIVDGALGVGDAVGDLISAVAEGIAGLFV
jgi:hypothetical protein